MRGEKDGSKSLETELFDKDVMVAVPSERGQLSLPLQPGSRNLRCWFLPSSEVKPVGHLMSHQLTASFLPVHTPVPQLLLTISFFHSGLDR